MSYEVRVDVSEYGGTLYRRKIAQDSLERTHWTKFGEIGNAQIALQLVSLLRKLGIRVSVEDRS